MNSTGYIQNTATRRLRVYCSLTWIILLDEETIKEIERRRRRKLLRIFGLGESISTEKIYSNWDLVDKMPDGVDIVYG